MRTKIREKTDSSVNPIVCDRRARWPTGAPTVRLASKRRAAAGFVTAAVCVVALGLPACVTELDDLGGADVFEPIDEGDNIDEQGLYSCEERSDRGYRAGNSFAIKVVTVDGRPVEVDTANAYIVMQEAARRAGVHIRIVSGFRTHAEQQYLYGCYVNCSCNSCNLAATPGYSNHQSGHALDLNTADGSVLNWLNNNGARFGFRRTVASEPWHWEWWSGGPGGGPCGDNGLPKACNTGDYDGVYCDDDKNGNEAEHNYLWNTLDVKWRCEDKAGQRAFCPGKDASRAEAMMVLGKAFDMPTRNLRNAFVDDGGHRYERFLNGAAHFDILEGDGRRITPNKTLSRSGLAVITQAHLRPAPHQPRLRRRRRRPEHRRRPQPRRRRRPHHGLRRRPRPPRLQRRPRRQSQHPRRRRPPRRP